MLHTRKSFTVPVSEGDGSFCREKGHSAPDARGRCLSCGAKVVAPTLNTGGTTPATPEQLREKARGISQSAHPHLSSRS
jgi:hypothetical protein